MFFKTLIQAGHTRSFTVQAHREDGWEVRIEQDSQVIRQRRYTDWHRVERALSAIQREVESLQMQGWQALGGDHRAPAFSR